MPRKLTSQHMLTAVFLVFILMLVSVVFVPNITAAATLREQGDNISLMLIWALPILAIVAFLVFFSHRDICAKKAHE